MFHGSQRIASAAPEPDELRISLNEQVLTVAQAAKLVPKRRGQKLCSPSTVFRWITKGIGGIRLESIVVGGSLCTSAEALLRFFLKLGAARSGRG